MPLSTTAAFPTGYETWQTIDYTVDHIGDANRELDLYVLKITNVIDRIEHKVGYDNDPTASTLDFQARSYAQRRTINVQDFGVLPSNSGSVNAFTFNLNEGSTTTYPLAGIYATQFFFPIGTYATTGFGITKSNHEVISGTGMYGAVVNYVGAGTGGSCWYVRGSPTGGGYGNRLDGVRFENMLMTNGAAQNNKCFTLRHITGMVFTHLMIQAFRGDGTVDGSNFSDSHFYHCDWQFCASNDDSDFPVLKFWYDGNGLWGCDALTFFRCKLEVNGDRLIYIAGSSGFRINKVTFLATKFENTGTESYKMGGSSTGAQVWVEEASNISFVNVDMTLQDLRAGHAILPTIFRLKGSTDVHCIQLVFSFGSGGRAKCFNYFFILDNGSQVLTLVDVWVNCGDVSGAAFPNQVISCTGSPRVVYRCVGFDPTNGSAKTAADWITGSVANVAGGAGGGVIA